MIRQSAAALVFGLLALLPGARTDSQTPGDALSGIWSCTIDYVPPLRGELTVRRDGSVWEAQLAKHVATGRADGMSVQLAFDGGRGEFRGTLSRDLRELQGFWIQAPGVTPDPGDPGYSGQAYASPLVLRAASDHVWRGTVRPLHDRFTLYLHIARNASGVLSASFENPEMNSIGGASSFSVFVAGNDVQLTARKTNPAEPETTLSATLRSSPDRLEMVWADLARKIVLTRSTPDEIADFYPRPPGSAPYVYRKPPDTGDGWSTAAAADVGMDERALAHLVQRLSDPDPRVRHNALIHSLLIARHGKLVLEEYFFGFNRDTVHDLRSAGKTYASVMVGAAMMRGVPISPETRVYALLQDMGPFANPDPRKAQITLGELMAHTSGLACDDNDDRSPGNESTMQGQTGQPNWWKYTLDLPMAYDPGTHYAYCSAGMNLVGAAITTATGTWLPTWFDRTVARPLQFGTYYWNLMPNGEGYLGGGAFVRPRDFLKLGQTYLDNGVWNGRRIVEASWVSASTAPHPPVGETASSVDGYAWHLGKLQVGNRSYQEYSANGNGGQMLVVIPELDMTIAFTAGNYEQYGIWGKFLTQIVPQEIIPAIDR